MTSVPTHLKETLTSGSMMAGMYSTIPLCPMFHDPISGWREAPPLESPTLLVRLEVHMATYSALQLPTPMASNNKCPMPGKVRSIADSGAQMDILALRELEAMRVLPSSLLPVLAQVSGASHGSSINIIGASQSVFWPNMSQEITATRAHCSPCTRSAPSNPSMPPSQPVQPDFPFSHCCMDFFEVQGQTYLALVDRYTGWLSVLCLAKDNSDNVIAALRQYFARWGVSKQLTSDGARVFTSAKLKDFFDRWGVQHRVSSAYYPRANKRSEVAVKSAKRLIMENIGPKGQLDTDRFARALLLHRNTPDPMTGLFLP